MQKRELPDGWDKNLPTFPADAKGMATRESSGNVLNAVAENVPWLVGGSADLGRFRPDAAEVRRRRRLPGRQLRRTQPALRRARARHGRGLERHGGFEDPTLRRHLLQFQRLHAAVDPAGRVDGDSRRSMSLPTIPSAWEKTAPRTSRSSNWRRCGPCRD